jgi:hypothetical protein
METIDTRDYALSLSKSLNKTAYVTLIESLGATLNDRKDRFDKSDIIEQSLEVYTNGRLNWVDDIGRDHNDSETGYDLEFKYTADGMFTKKGKTPKKIVKVKLKNSLGKNKGTTIDNPADFYIIGQQDAIAIISFKEVEPFLVGVADGIEAHIPFEELTFIFLPSDITIVTTKQMDYKQIKAEAQRKLIEGVLSQLNKSKSANDNI